MTPILWKGGNTMKKEYESVELEVVRFDAEDIITTSKETPTTADGQVVK